ncbi:tetratricopeptide repeat protein [Streptacidiphilus sp. PAMC 29251]
MAKAKAAGATKEGPESYEARLSALIDDWGSASDENADAVLDVILEWDHPEAAEEYLQARAASGDAASHEALADLLIQLHRYADACDHLKAAHEMGRPVSLWLAALLAEEIGDQSEAENWYRRAVAAEIPGSLNDFGVFLRDDPSRSDEAATLLTTAATSGDVLGMANLGKHLSERGEHAEALRWLTKAVAMGREAALVPLAAAEIAADMPERAERHLKAAIDLQVPGAILARAEFLAESDPDTQQFQEADAAFRAALEAEEEGTAFAYAVYLSDSERVAEAEQYYLRAAEEGEVNSFLNLALLYEDQGLVAKSDEFYRKAVEIEDIEAMIEYGIFLRGHNRGSEIESLAGEARRCGASEKEIAKIIFNG